MFARISSPLFVVLILANPVFCQMRGLCDYWPRGDCEQRCASCLCERDAGCREREQCDGPCQKQEAPAKPCDCPGDSYCQCLSAGAVVKEAASLDDAQDGFALD